MSKQVKTAADVASEIATKKVTESKTEPTDIQPTMPSDKTLTSSALKLLERAKTKTVTLVSGRAGLTFEIRHVQAADVYAGMGSLLLRRLSEHGIEAPEGGFDNDFLAKKAEELITPEEMSQHENSESMLKHKRMIVCQGVVDVDFADLPQEECPVNVVSARMFTTNELTELANAIINFSAPERDVTTFREAGGKDESEQSG